MNNSLEHARHHFQETVAALKAQNTELAIQRCRDFLVTSPGSLPHLQLLAHALVKQSQFTEAEQTLKHALSLVPDNPAFHDELGSLYAQSGRLEDAVTALQQACHLQSNPLTYKKLASVLQLLGRDEEAEDAFNHFLKHDPINADVAEGAEHCRAGRYQEAEDTLKAVLRQKPDHVDAMRFLAMTYESANKLPHDAEALLRNAIKIAPDYTQALSNLGTLLLDRHKWQDAIDIYQKLVTYMPNHALAWASLAHAQTRNGDIDNGLCHYDRALACDANSAGIHMSRAHLLKTLGRMPEALDAYRAATRLKPALGEAWWSMANLKIFRFEAEEVSVMMQQLERDDLSDEARVHFYFSLGKAFEDQKNYDQAWHHYHQGNQLQRTLVDYDPVEHEMLIDSLHSAFTAEVAAPLINQGSDRADPIFIVGLPRSGSTLIEQILARRFMSALSTGSIRASMQVCHQTGHLSRPTHC